LERLHGEHDLVLAVAQPDKPAGRGMRARRPAVARRADELGVPVAQPARLKRDDAFRARLREAALDVAVTAAYGKILPADLLGVPRHGFLNAHASLLPELRGAAPIQWALIRGHTETGVSVMQTEPGLDTGPVRHVARTGIDPDETAPELAGRLSSLAADAMSEALRRLAEGRLPSRPQDDDLATEAPLLTKEDGHVRWADGARAVYDRWRGVVAWPGTRFAHAGARVRADRLRVAAEGGREGAPGEVVGIGADAVRVACGAGAVELDEVTPPGRRTMAAAAWARGAGLGTGDRLA
jgi:methionyl-tRNA formyltransferase